MSNARSSFAPADVFGSAIGLRARLLALVLTAIVLLLCASALAVYLGTRSFVDALADTELERAELVWERFFELRQRRLLEAVSVLAEDFGFREAVASGDAATGMSALLNHAARVDADLVILLSAEGKPLLLVPDVNEDELSPSITGLLARPDADQGVIGLIEVDGLLVQLALVPVRAPARVAWAGFGFVLSDETLLDFRGLTGADLSLVSADGLSVLASSLQEPAVSEVVAAVARATPARARRVDDQVLRLLALERSDGGSNLLALQLDHDVLARPMGELRQRILLLSILAGLPMLVLGALAARALARPLQRLVAVVDGIAEGDYQQAIQVVGRDEVARLAGAVVDMREGIQARQAQIERQARSDSLTGLANRSSALATLASVSAESDARVRRLLLFDIRRFAVINDTLGPAIGDQLLLAAADRLRAERPTALLARMGANEFLVLETEPANPVAESEVIDLLALLERAYAIDAAQVRLEFCIGWAELPSHADTGEQLLRRAQLALADAKAAGLPFCAYRPGREAFHLRQLRLLADLRGAEAGGELFVMFQPKVDLRSGQLVHVEALLRWRHAQLGLVGPDEFIPLAERSGLVHGLTRYVLRQSLGACSGWQAQGLQIDVAVNLSALDLADAGLAAYVERALAEWQLPATRLILEVTESAVMRDVEQSIEQLQRLRLLGVRIAVDDFGTGHSSLAQLQRLPTDELKIDKSFVLALTHGSADAEIVRIAVELGHSLGLKVIAEGVETIESLRVLRRVGCDLGQGYLFSRPIDEAALLPWSRTFRFPMPDDESPP
jgi:diguanylate cyclase (GGDEF)-like protein